MRTERIAIKELVEAIVPTLERPMDHEDVARLPIEIQHSRAAIENAWASLRLAPYTSLADGRHGTIEFYAGAG